MPGGSWLGPFTMLLFCCCWDMLLTDVMRCCWAWVTNIWPCKIHIVKKYKTFFYKAPEQDRRGSVFSGDPSSKIFFNGAVHGMRILNLCFFHQTTPPGPIKDILGPFSFLTIFNGVIQVFKRLPAESPASGSPGIHNSPVSRSPGSLFFKCP